MFPVIVLFAVISSVAAASDDPVLRAADQEVERAMEVFSSMERAPYFLGVEITETHRVDLVGEYGGLQPYEPSAIRWVDVDVRLGDRNFDSTHPLRSASDSNQKNGRRLALGDDVTVIQRGIWSEVDRRTRMAYDRWAKVLADQQTLVQEVPAPDLVEVATHEYLADLQMQPWDDLSLSEWEQTIRSASAVFSGSETVHTGYARLDARALTRWFVSSEGTRIRTQTQYLRASVNASTTAEDGTQLSLSQAWSARNPAALPGKEEILAAAASLEMDLANLVAAPEQEPFKGPALLGGRAAAVLFHEVFGHRMEGHRLKKVQDAQTFRSMVGEPILPEFLSVFDDAPQASLGETELNGHYSFDNQGVPAQRVPLVDDGVLVGFLQSRSPVSQGDGSNGHGRRQIGHDVVTRQGNLWVEATQSVSDEMLREELRRLAEEQGLEYGLQIDEITGGFTFTGRRIPNAYNVGVVRAKRVFVDGRPDELVKGIDLIGTPLATFALILMAGDQPEVFNGVCGAESGWVPVSAVSPAILVSQVETQRKTKEQGVPPLLPPPTEASTVVTEGAP